MSCGVGCRSDLDAVWLWRRLAAVSLIRPLAWEPPYATGEALEKTETPPKKNPKKPQTLDYLRILTWNPTSAMTNVKTKTNVFHLIKMAIITKLSKFIS